MEIIIDVLFFDVFASLTIKKDEKMVEKMKSEKKQRFIIGNKQSTLNAGSMDMDIVLSYMSKK